MIVLVGIIFAVMLAIYFFCDWNAKLCRELANKLAANGEHATAEMQRICAEQSEGTATAIRSRKDG